MPRSANFQNLLAFWNAHASRHSSKQSTSISTKQNSSVHNSPQQHTMPTIATLPLINAVISKLNALPASVPKPAVAAVPGVPTTIAVGKNERYHNSNNNNNDSNVNDTTAVSISAVLASAGTANASVEKQLLQLIHARKEAALAPLCKTTVVVAGAGPVGLKLALELAIQGACVTVFEKRELITRNNVLHVWTQLVACLQNDGVKILYPKFGSDAIHHISIKKLTVVFVTLCKLAGVDIIHSHTVSRVDEAANHYVVHLTNNRTESCNAFFDCSGAASSLLQHTLGSKKFRGAPAIGLTCNFANTHTKAEIRVPEISGLSSYFKRSMFADLKKASGLELENIVYFRDETHYLVATIKLESLVNQGVFVHSNNKRVLSELLAKSNVHSDRLKAVAKSLMKNASELLNGVSLPDATLDSIQDDLAVFDFGTMHACCLPGIVKRGEDGQSILAIGAVGDAALSPFWPQGTGVNRGLMMAMDAVNALRSAFTGRDVDSVNAEWLRAFKFIKLALPENLKAAAKSRDWIQPSERYNFNGA